MSSNVMISFLCHECRVFIPGDPEKLEELPCSGLTEPRKCNRCGRMVNTKTEQYHFYCRRELPQSPPGKQCPQCGIPESDRFFRGVSMADSFSLYSCPHHEFRSKLSPCRFCGKADTFCRQVPCHVPCSDCYCDDPACVQKCRELYTPSQI